ncbi:unnamed protein product [Angiostrongylus costaricensis]|uniref:Gnk2-homologous domain-containing protein n=1 Tax=Angiostrongylus costaricensis TaxID=334426 RepID=A0A0R3PHZ7_ANGCS|nr:unnamed protein product [Angiostrongylus costaricensis]
MHWKTTTILFCVYGITKGLRPTTPFLTQYLVSPHKNFTLDKVYGFTSAADVAYYSYLYAIVNERNYRRVTSCDRCADLTRKLLACNLAHLSICPRTATYLTLNQILVLPYMSDANFVDISISFHHFAEFYIRQVLNVHSKHFSDCTTVLRFR